MTLIEDFNQKRIRDSDGPGMMLVGKAAHLLRSKKETNEAEDDAEKASVKTPELFLARSASFLEASNLGRAEEMIRKALQAAPELAEAHITMAELELAQMLDYDLAGARAILGSEACGDTRGRGSLRQCSTPTVSTTFPVFCPASTYRVASRKSSSGYVRSMIAR